MAAAFRPLLLLAMIHGLQGFYLPGQLIPHRQGRMHQPLGRQSPRCARIIGRDRALQDLHAQLDIRAATHGRKTTVPGPPC